MAELQFNKKIKALQTDGAKEYLVLTKYLADHGIKHRISCPHTHEQNGAPERKHRHLTETVLTLLAASCLPSKFWAEAFSIATLIINHIPSPVIHYKSPFEVLFHKTPDYSIFKPFGCLCYPYLRPYTKTKLEFRSTPCIFLGYNTKYKGYKCITNSGREYTVRHIIFDETQYPMIANPSFFAPNTIVSPTQPTFPPSIATINPINPPASTPAAPITPIPDPIPPTSITPVTEHSTPPNPATNTHPMTTRAKSGIFKPKALLTEMTPRCTKDALQNP